MQVASEQFTESLVFSLNNKSDGVKNPFQPAEEVFQGFKWLAEVYAPSRLGTKRCANLYHSIREKIPGWGYSAKQSDLTSGRFEEWYECHWQGRAYGIEEHIGCGTTARPEETIKLRLPGTKNAKNRHRIHRPTPKEYEVMTTRRSPYPAETPPYLSKEQGRKALLVMKEKGEQILNARPIPKATFETWSQSAFDNIKKIYSVREPAT